MQAAMAFTRRQFEARATQFAQGGGTDPWSGKSLGGMSRGLSVLGSVMEYASIRQKASAMDQEARDETLAARQEYVTAAEQVNAIDAQFNALVSEQRAAAAEMGIDVGSGSVTAARNEARDSAERERKILRNSADMNAAQRRLRAVRLRDAAKGARFGGLVSAGLNIAGAFI